MVPTHLPRRQRPLHLPLCYTPIFWSANTTPDCTFRRRICMTGVPIGFRFLRRRGYYRVASKSPLLTTMGSFSAQSARTCSSVLFYLRADSLIGCQSMLIGVAPRVVPDSGLVTRCLVYCAQPLLSLSSLLSQDGPSLSILIV